MKAKIQITDDTGEIFEGETNLIKVATNKNKNTAIKIRPHKESSITDYLLSLKSEGFFRTPRSLKDIINKLADKNRHYMPQSLTYSLLDAVKKGRLGRIKKNKKWAYVER